MCFVPVFGQHCDEGISMTEFRGNKIVSVVQASVAKVNKDQRIGRIRIKKEGEMRTKT